MKKFQNRTRVSIYLLSIVALMLAVTASTYAWNTAAMRVNALAFERNGKVNFTLFARGRGGSEFRCSEGSGGQWLRIRACSAADRSCLVSVERMAELLLAAKLHGKSVHVGRDGCTVTSVALKP